MGFTNILLCIIIVFMIVIGWMVENIEEHLKFFRELKEEEIKQKNTDTKILHEMRDKIKRERIND